MTDDHKQGVTPYWSVVWPESIITEPWILSESWVKWIAGDDPEAIPLISMDGIKWKKYRETEPRE